VKQHLNTLFVQTQGTYLAKDGQAVAVRGEGDDGERKTLLRVPVHNLGGIVAFGRVGVSPALMRLCCESGVAISLLSEHGRLQGRIVGFTPGNVLLRREQYRRTDDAAGCAKIVKHVVSGKIANSRAVLLRHLRDNADAAGGNDVRKAAARLAVVGRDVAGKTLDIDRLRGLEGEASAAYFGVFDHLVVQQKEAFGFAGRSRRPPTDPINALLSFLYAMLANDARSACEACGLDPQVGFLHRDRPGRPSLALDLMEELRPVLCDRLVLSLVNRKQVGPKDFETATTGGVRLKDKPRRAVLAAYQKRKQDTLVHPYLEEKVSLGLVVHLQARLLSRHLRGDLDAYPPFIWK
jgi:CRISPR-associated protein Cas1